MEAGKDISVLLEEMRQAEPSLLEEAHLPPEVDDEGKVEYKRRLCNLTPERLEELTTQLKWRLAEGQGEAIYELGVDDDGYPRGISAQEFAESQENLSKMATALSAEVTLVCEKMVGEDRKVAEFLIRKFGDDNVIGLNICVCGNVDSGKSTTIAVLTKGGLDNGRGLARASVFRHPHEIETGRTSSIAQALLGFDKKGEIVNYGNSSGDAGGSAPISPIEVAERSAKTILFCDLPGHEKYLRTAVSGLAGQMPEFSMVLVGSNMGLSKMTREHFGLCLALKIPVFFVVTKIDLCPSNILLETLQSIHKLLKLPGVRKLHVHVRSMDDVVLAAKNIASDRVVPIFEISSVTGANLDLLRAFLNLLPARTNWEERLTRPTEFVVDEIFFVTGVGVVVSGLVTAGSISANDTLLLGPDGNGQFRTAKVRSIHCKRVPVRRIVAGQHASLALKGEKRQAIRKGMVLVDPSVHPQAVFEFDADVLVLHHSTSIRVGYQPVLHANQVRQACTIVSISKDMLRTGDRATVRFRFTYRPEYVAVGTRIIFREGRTRGQGIVTSLDAAAAPSSSSVPVAGSSVTTPAASSSAVS